jgi:hypothetical protein
LNQDTHFSLWPKPSAWSRSGKNVGYWSPDAEEWFQCRVAYLLYDEPIAKQKFVEKAADWARGMQTPRQGYNLRKAVSMAAAKFLQKAIEA